MKVHALRYANLATYTRQIFLSKLKLLQTRQTSRKNKKQSKAELGYDLTIGSCFSVYHRVMEHAGSLESTKET